MEDEAAALAGRAFLGERLDQTLADALAGHLHQSERGDFGHLMLGAVACQAFDQAAQHQIAVGGHDHIHIVDHHHAADIAQAQLAGDLFETPPSCNAVTVSSKDLPLPIKRPVFTSMVVMASVRSMTIEPPDGR